MENFEGGTGPISSPIGPDFHCNGHPRLTT